MEIVTCIEKIRDNHGVIKKYILNNKENLLIKIEPSALKWNIQNGRLLVDNLKLTADNSCMVIKKKIFGGRYEEPIKARIVARVKNGNKELLLSDNVELVHINKAIMPM